MPGALGVAGEVVWREGGLWGRCDERGACRQEGWFPGAGTGLTFQRGPRFRVQLNWIAEAWRCSRVVMVVVSELKDRLVLWCGGGKEDAYLDKEVAKWSAMPNSPSMYGMAVPSCPPLVMCCPHKGAAPQPGRQQPWGGLIGPIPNITLFSSLLSGNCPALGLWLKPPVTKKPSATADLLPSSPCGEGCQQAGSAASLSCMTEPTASTHRVGLGTARDPHHASTSDFMSTPALAFHSRGLTDRPFVRLLPREQNLFASCLAACEGHSAHCHRWWRRQWLEGDVLLSTQASPGQHQQLLAVSSGLPSTLSSCPRLAIIFHRRLSFSLSHGSCIFPGVTTSPAIHFQSARSSRGESCGSQWVWRGSQGTAGLIPGGLRKGQPQLPWLRLVWPAETLTPSTSCPAAHSPQTRCQICNKLQCCLAGQLLSAALHGLQSNVLILALFCCDSQ
ncbi:hypothetical protein E2C01_016549 [Portunus trituberculatus]|uniref:Uncharacterized protein n=1 Tax=Portunus trituberculatus TaxID=210409 RepID=A0A5B7DR07_PORTR|nr:hypothetical protein [Portunus trituberculatus]